MQLIIALTKRLFWFHDAVQNSLNANGVAPLTRAQTFVIGNIAAGETRATKIARNLGVSRQAVSQILLQLESRGDITLEDDPSDGRSRVVKFGADFETNGNVCASIFQALEAELEHRIGRRRLANFKEVLDEDWGEPPTVNSAVAGVPEQPKRRRQAP